VPVLGITGTGGAGKSSLTDELVRRFRRDREDKLRLAVLAIDPSRRRGGGALLGDRIRMNTISPGRVFFRSMATRLAEGGLPEQLADAIAACKAAGADLVIVETPGIGQGDAGIVPFVDTALYVMTPEFGAASQLEKIDMLDFADVVAINKFERRGRRTPVGMWPGSWSATGRRSGRRGRTCRCSGPPRPASTTMGSRRCTRSSPASSSDHGLERVEGVLPRVDTRVSTGLSAVIEPGRERYLAEVAEVVRSYHAHTVEQAELVRRRHALQVARDEVAPVAQRGAPARGQVGTDRGSTDRGAAAGVSDEAVLAVLDARLEELAAGIDPEVDRLLWRAGSARSRPTRGRSTSTRSGTVRSGCR
jgi:isobutyryl-CoA mutase